MSRVKRTVTVINPCEGNFNHQDIEVPEPIELEGDQVTWRGRSTVIVNYRGGKLKVPRNKVTVMHLVDFEGQTVVEDTFQ